MVTRALMERMEIMEAALESSWVNTTIKRLAPQLTTLHFCSRIRRTKYMTCMGVVLINFCIKRYGRGGLGTSVLGAIRPNCKFVTRHMSG